MRTILSLTFVVAFCSYCSAQDTTIIYVAKTGDTTLKENAVSYFKIYGNGNFWHGAEYNIKDNKLKSEADYTNKSLDTVHGIFKLYDKDEKLESASTYNNGELTEINYYYKNGDKKSRLAFNNKNITEQKGWDENGKEIKDYIVRREARFKGSLEAWTNYLQKNLHPDVAVNSGAPAGNYSVEVTFLVDKQGYISEVKASSIPDKCHACAKEAVSVIMNGPN